MLCDDVAEVRSALHDVLAANPSIVIVGEADNGWGCVHVCIWSANWIRTFGADRYLEKSRRQTSWLLS